MKKTDQKAIKQTTKKLILTTEQLAQATGGGDGRSYTVSNAK